MTIRRKLWLGFGLLIVLFTGLGAYQNVQLGHLGKSAVAAFEYPLTAVDQSRAAWDTFRSSRELVAKHLARIQFSDANESERMLMEYQQRFLQQLEEAHQATEALMVMGDFEQLKAWADQWYELNSHRIGAGSQTQLPDERTLTEIDHKLGQAVEQLVQNSLSAAAEREQHTIELVSQVRTLSLVTLIATVVIGVLMALGLAHSLTKPLAELLAAMRDLTGGEGDLTRRLNLQRKDEIGLLADEVDVFISDIHQLVGETRQSLGEAANTLQMVGELTGNTHSGVEQQKARIEETSAAVVQMTEAVQSVSDNSVTAKTQAGLINGQTQENLQLVAASADSISRLADEVSNASASIQELAEASESIAELLTVIETIADQTNLLALNAAIEAARAGEAGRGFAVVADEVRTLAMKTRESTDNIQTTVGGIHERVTTARGVMDQGRALAIDCVEQSQAVSEALVNMSENVASIEHMNLGIAAETEQQRASMHEINGNMCHVNDVADQTADTAHQLQQGRAQLEQALARVEATMAQFKL